MTKRLKYALIAYAMIGLVIWHVTGFFFAFVWWFGMFIFGLFNLDFFLDD